MLDETLSLWTSVNSWLTPAVLFLLLNLVIGTIAFTSANPHPSPASANPHDPQPLPRSPSVLHRHRSLHLSRSEAPPPSPDSHLPHSAPDPVIPLHPENAPPEEPMTEELVESGEEIEEDVGGLEGPTMEQVFSQIQKGGGVYCRSVSDGGQFTPRRKARRRRNLQRAASDISSATGQFAPAAVPEAENEGEEVDGKAEDFINKFRKQLNLQRMESLYRVN